MESQTSRTRYSPSLMWVLPIACSIWIGLIVEGWFAHVVIRDRILAAGDSALESMAAPAFIMLLGWLVFTPANWGDRARVLGFIFLTSVPVAYLSFQQPGQDFTKLWLPVQHYANHVYFAELLNLRLHDSIIVVGASLGIMMAFNRWMSRIVFQRIPVQIKPGARSNRSDLYYAYWGPTPLEDSEFEASHLRNELLVWSFIGVCLLIGCGWYVATESLLKFHSLLLTGLGVAMMTYLWIWIASQYYSPWRTLWFLAIGATSVSALAQLIEFATAFGPSSPASELSICGTAGIVSALLVTSSLFLLARTHQMPRRCRKRIRGWTPVDYYESEKSQSCSRIRFWIIGLLMFVLTCGLAYWVPTRIDPAEFTDETDLSFRDDWLAAQL